MSEVDLDDMIAALEAAERPSRELDWLIAERIGLPVVYRSGTTAMSQQFPFRVHADGGVDEVPRYTASLDAAVTLVPDGWEKSGFLAWPAYVDGRLVGTAYVELHHVLSSGGGPNVTGIGGTSALALCIAALHARKKGIR